MPNYFNLTTAAGAIAVASVYVLPVNAAIPNYDAVYVFGDSYSDRGNVLNVTGSVFPPEPFYSGGRFTLGLNWVDYFAQETGLNPTELTKLTPGNPIPDDGINFAFGGATSGKDNIGNLGNPGANLPGLEQQVDAYELLLGGKEADPNALYVLFASGNDYFGGFATDPTGPISNLSKEIDTLASLGARNILVANLPSLGNTPFGRSLGPQTAANLNSLTDAHNALLDQSLAQLRQKYSTTNLIEFDFQGLFQRLLNNPNAFGFANVTDSCSNINFPNVTPEDFDNWSLCRSSLERDPKAFLFYDNQHATSAGYRVIADEILNTVSVPEPTTVTALGLLSLGLLGQAFKKKFSDKP
jgi:cholinesterase